MVAVNSRQPAARGVVVAAKTFDAEAIRRQFVQDDVRGHFRPERERLLLGNQVRSTWRRNFLAWLRDNVHPQIPRVYYNAVLGHDLHVSAFATLHMQVFHASQPDPFHPGKMGWLENVGLVSAGKVTTAFRDFEIDRLIADATDYGDFKFHEVGTSTAAEANTQTALTTTTGIARVSGTQVEAAADQYQSVATVTADTAETWGEHGIFNVSTAGTMLDRSVLSPTQAVNISDQVTFTYTLTKNAEA